MGSITINNKSYVGNSISIVGNKVYIDGVLQEDDSKKIYITVQGNIENLDVDIPILIKSTISIEGWDMLTHMFPHTSLTFSPEFLRAASALEDFKNNKTILLGGGDTNFWSDLFVTAMGKVNIDIAKPKELILAKYARNSFLALKVAYFNQINDLCTKLDVDYDKVRQYTTLDDRIGDSHTTITDERGFGGHCFPKDTEAFVTSSKRVDSNLSILEHAIEYNQSIRKGTT